MSGEFRDGVYFVDFAATRDPNLVLPTIARVLSLRETGGSTDVLLARLLQEQELLLFLDSFEHLVAAAPFLAELLAACPGLKALVTSQRVLNAAGEQDFPVSPLDLPAAGTPFVAKQLRGFPAVQLFAARAQAAQPGFDVTDETASSVAAICRQLDGLPLAIELAAARIRVFSPQTLLARLAHRLPVLIGGPRDAPARHQTMRAAIAWSYELLAPAEQALFRRLAVFAGGFTVETAEQVAAGGMAPPAYPAPP